MDDLHGGGLPDGRLLEGPDTLSHGLCSISNYQHDQLPVLLGHNLRFLHEGRGLALSYWCSCRLGLDVEVELGLELAVLVLDDALVVAPVVRCGFLNWTKV